MKPYILLIMILLPLLLINCVKKRVFYPIPVTVSQLVPVITGQGGSFEESSHFASTEIETEIRKKLNELSDVQINNTLLEGVAYTVVETNSPETNLTGLFRISYGGSPLTQLLELKDVNFGKVLNKPQTVELTEAGVDIMVQALSDIVNSRASEDLQFQVKGTANPVPAQGLQFLLKIELQIDIVVDQCQEIFDVLGSSDAQCK